MSAAVMTIPTFGRPYEIVEEDGQIRIVFGDEQSLPVKPQAGGLRPTTPAEKTHRFRARFVPKQSGHGYNSRSERCRRARYHFIRQIGNLDKTKGWSFIKRANLAADLGISARLLQDIRRDAVAAGFVRWEMNRKVLRVQLTEAGEQYKRRYLAFRAIGKRRKRQSLPAVAPESEGRKSEFETPVAGKHPATAGKRSGNAAPIYTPSYTHSLDPITAQIFKTAIADLRSRAMEPFATKFIDPISIFESPEGPALIAMDQRHRKHFAQRYFAEFRDLLARAAGDAGREPPTNVIIYLPEEIPAHQHQRGIA